MNHSPTHSIAPIRMQDQLAVDLGALEDGDVFEYNYTDAVRLAGHSCPAVSGAFRMTAIAVDRLYESGLGERGDISVSVRGPENRGVNGPISQVITMITGAAGMNGFHGLGGTLHQRNGLLTFTEEQPPDDITFSCRFTRISSGTQLVITYRTARLPGIPALQPLMKKLISGTIQSDEKETFTQLWQERVRTVLLGDIFGLFVIEADVA